MLKRLGVAAGVFVSLFLFTKVVSASHSWNGYHWARTANPFTLKLGSNTSGTWTNLLSLVSSDWSASSVLDTNVTAGGTKPKPCQATKGRVEVCNANYGNTGWLGVAQIWITDGVHITQGTVKNNDYYFGNSTYKYNNEAEKRHVICQEVGHTLGLDHQSTDGTSQNTCMDYYQNTNNADTKSTQPNTHDYDELAAIYSGTDSYSTVLSAVSKFAFALTGNVDASDASQWGKVVKENARESMYERDLGFGNKVFTLVTWAK